MRFAIVIEQAGNNYSAHCAGPSGLRRNGKTVAAAKEEIRDAIRFHIEGLQPDGIAVPPPTSIAEYVET
jgi:predicted RNase H-like HicB family nuclease